MDAIKNYYETRDNLVALYGIHEAKLQEWLGMDRSPRVNSTGKAKLSVFSVYNHNTTRGEKDVSSISFNLLTRLFTVLTYQQVMDRLVKSQEKICCANWWVAESDVAQWLREALLVEDAE